MAPIDVLSRGGGNSGDSIKSCSIWVRATCQGIQLVCTGLRLAPVCACCGPMGLGCRVSLGPANFRHKGT